MMRLEALRRIDGDGGDLLGRIVRHILDIHAAFGRNDQGDAVAGAVDQHREVEFLVDIDAVGDIKPVDLLACIAGLDRHQRVAEHLLGVGFDIGERMGQPHAALGIRAQFLELALAAPAGVDLRLHHIKRPGQLLCARNCLIDRQRGMARRNADAEFRQQFLGLIFMDVHVSDSLSAAGLPGEG